MTLAHELCEALASLAPVALSFLPFIRPPRLVGSWVGYVVLTAAMSVLSMGFLMMRLTGQCVPVEETCSERLVPLMPGILESLPPCSVCLPKTASWSERAAVELNGLQEAIGLGAALVCTLISLAILVRFAAWVRRQAS